MRNRQLFGFLLPILLILFLAGCGSNGNDGQTYFDESDIYTGTDSLGIELMENMPQDEAYQNSVVKFGMILSNKGAFDITDGFLALSVEDDYLSIDSWDLKGVNGNILSGNEVVTFGLRGKSIRDQNGESGFAIATLKSKTIPKQEPKEHTSTIVLSACYPYHTLLSEAVCVDTDIYNLKNIKKSCEIEDISSSGQGAPIAVTDVKVNMIPDADGSIIKPEFIIKIENLGEGRALFNNPTSIENACTSETLTKDDFNKIIVWAKLSDKSLKCKPSDKKIDPNEYVGFVDITEENLEIRCVLDEGISLDKGTYLSPLLIELKYGYIYSISKDIVIKRGI